MSLRRFTSQYRTVLPAVGMALLTACAADGIERGQDVRERNASVESPAADAAAPAAVLTMYEQATAVMAAGDHVEAELRFSEFLLRYPGYPGAHVNLAIIHAQNENDDAARSALSAALLINPNHAGALNLSGMLHRKSGNFPEAEAAYLKAVTANPGYPLAHYNLGVLNELYLQRLDAALYHFEEYQSLIGNDQQVEKWITDLRRRVTAAQRTANVAD